MFLKSFCWIILFIGFLSLHSPITVICLISKKMTEKNAKFIMYVLLKFLKYTVGINYRVHGNSKQHGFFVSKHMSTMDVILLEYLVNKPIFIMKKELTRIPVYGWFFLRLGFIAIDRKQGAIGMRKVKEKIIQKIKDGYNPIIFPEGTRTNPGTHNSFKRGILFFAEDVNIDVIPVGLNTGLFWGKNQFIKKPGTVDIYFNEPMKLNFEKLVAKIQETSA